MACYHPIPALKEGKKVRLWAGLTDANIAIPCGKCVGCLTDRATTWAHRCEHEAKRWRHNIFITLTYADEHLPKEGHLDAPALTRFFKRLRKRIATDSTCLTSDSSSRIRYFACGEYGSKFGRPHYHVLAFNLDFRDRKRVGEKNGNALYESATLNDIWPFGTAKFGDAKPEAASYIAQYTLKKQHSRAYIDEDGVYTPPPFLRMSQKLGYEWLDKYKKDLSHGYLLENGYKHPIPRAYKKRLEKQDPDFLAEILTRVEQRHIAQRPGHYDNENHNPDRRQAAEIIHLARKRLIERQKRA